MLNNLNCSLIITTYNRPEALQLVLQSVLAQKTLPNEVIIADDGSSQETTDLIHKFQTDYPIPLKHIWQEDKGFRAATSRNKAIKAASFDYIVMIDGDMILHPQFIFDHKKSAKKGILIQGSRVLLGKEKTANLLQQPTAYRVFKWYEKDIEKRLSAIRIPFLSQWILKKEKAHQHRGIKTCNIAFFKQDAIAINGFNNYFIGWGREDSEFVARFFNNGGKRANLKFAGIAYHLWHKEANRDALAKNDQLLELAINKKLKWCENGLAQIK